MLTQLRLDNFKAYRQVDIKLTPITVFVGPNNGGKSSLFHAIQLLRQGTKSGNDGNLVPAKPPERTTSRSSAAASYGYPRHSVEVGDFEDIIRHGERVLRIGIDGNTEVPGSGDVQVEYDLWVSDNVPTRQKGEIRCRGQALQWDQNWRGSETRNVSIRPDENVVFHFQPNNSISSPIRGSGWSSPRNLSFEETRVHEGLRLGFDQAIPTLLKSIQTAYGIRGFEEHGYHVGEQPGDFEFQLLDDRALAISSAFPYNRDFEDQTNAWLSKLLGVRIRFEMTKTKRVLVRVERARGVSRTLIVNEGLGLQQLLFILLPIVNTPMGGSLLIEEPEAHLHPRAQADLTRLLIETALVTKKQCLISTHSEHVLMTLILEVVKGRLRPSDFTIYYVERGENGTATVRPLKYDQTGRVEGGLPGFFDQKASELLSLGS